MERKKRKAYMLRISYEYDEQEKHFKDSGFMIGSKKKSKSDNSLSKKSKDCREEKQNDSYDYDGLKQINGRYYSQEEAKAAGLKWDDY